MIGGIFIGSVAILIVAYIVYGRFLNRQFGIDDTRATPAYTMTDGVDYVPTRRPVLFGHHFSSIAGAGPIVGPIIAATWFGWGPVLAWILIGSIFIGGVHDFGSLVMSVRHRSRSIAEICKAYLNPVTYRFFLVFIWLALVYVLVVFLDLTAASFVTVTEADPDQGGTVATASLVYIGLALVFGIATRKGMSLRAGSLIFVPMVFGALLMAHWLPTDPMLIRVLAPEGSWFFENPKYIWSVILLVYCFLASVTPVWLLLQPRDYLSSYLLFACLILGGLGLLVGGISGGNEIQYDAFIGWNSEKLGFIFPALFITVACGAVSGFHSIVSSGTTAKQLPAESAARPVAYGGMLTEGALAVIALATVMVLSGAPAGNPMVTFSAGIGQFMGALGFNPQWGTVFGLLAVSTFLLTTLDTCTRLARYIVEEFFGMRGTHWRYATTLLSLAPLFYFAFKTYPNPANPAVPIPAWSVIWPAFGTTNQLLAALALLVVVIWRRSQGRAIWFIFAPMLFMLASTVPSMVQMTLFNLNVTPLLERYWPGFVRDYATLWNFLNLNGANAAAVPAMGWIMAAMLVMTAVLVADTVLNWGKLGRRGELAGGVGAEAV